MRLQCVKNFRLAAFFRDRQAKIASRFAEISTNIPRWRSSYQVAARSNDLDAFIAAEFGVYPKYLERAFSSGDSVWLDLYAGEKLKQGYAVDGNFDEAKNHVKAIVDQEIAYLTSAAEREGLGDELTDLRNALNSVRSVLAADASRSLKILWIADCLYLDIRSFLVAPLASHSLDLQTDLVTTKNPIERQERTVALLESKSYDAIFYCPFSYENSFGYAHLFEPRHTVSNFLSARRIADSEFSIVEDMVLALDENAECPIFIQNASGVARHLGGWKDLLKDLSTRPARTLFCHSINSRLKHLSSTLNADRTANQTVIIDELAIAKANGLWDSGRYYDHYGLQHAARLGRYLAGAYLDALVTIHALLGKKVVVCDLDNTLWNGVIGEGEVAHHLDRQAILKSLKDKGVLLAINSKNNSDNVMWDGGVLNNEDFAGVRINWNTKVQNIGELAEEMNLKSDSFVFVDDRADERAMVSSVYPKTITLDSDDPTTWRRLALWEQILSGVGGIDRTQMYKKRLEREKFVSSSPQLSKASLFEQLELECVVSVSDVKSLPRITELLNRTNQFNTTGRRTSLKEVQSWHEDPAWSIYVANARDRFGDMGLVSVLAAHKENDHVEIEAFVLSCRVFGYGIETALLKTLIDTNSGRTICGIIVPTSVNQPCQSVFAVHNFRQVSDRWIFTGEPSSITNKNWLKIENKLDQMIPA